MLRGSGPFLRNGFAARGVRGGKHGGATGARLHGLSSHVPSSLASEAHHSDSSLDAQVVAPSSSSGAMKSASEHALSDPHDAGDAVRRTGRFLAAWSSPSPTDSSSDESTTTRRPRILLGVAPRLGVGPRLGWSLSLSSSDESSTTVRLRGQRRPESPAPRRVAAGVGRQSRTAHPRPRLGVLNVRLMLAMSRSGDDPRDVCDRGDCGDFGGGVQRPGRDRGDEQFASGHMPSAPPGLREGEGTAAGSASLEPDVLGDAVSTKETFCPTGSCVVPATLAGCTLCAVESSSSVRDVITADKSSASRKLRCLHSSKMFLSAATSIRPGTTNVRFYR